MNRYIFIRRLRGPAFLMLVGVIALLAQAHILSWGKSWPLYLILGGVLLLAERAALSSEGYPPYPGQMPGPYQAGAPYSDAGDPLASAAPAAGAATSGPIVASQNGTKYYYANCSGVSRISAANKVYFATPAAAAAAGYQLASGCKAP